MKYPYISNIDFSNIALSKESLTEYSRRDWNEDNPYGVAHAIKCLQRAMGYCDDISLSEYLDILIGERKHKCPKCGGNGYLIEKYDTYPRHLPDSGWVHDYKERKKCCDLCGGYGWTEKKYAEKTKVVSDGFYEVKEEDES